MPEKKERNEAIYKEWQEWKETWDQCRRGTRAILKKYKISDSRLYQIIRATRQKKKK